MNNIYQRLRGVNWIPSVLAACAMLLIAGQQYASADPIRSDFTVNLGSEDEGTPPWGSITLTGMDFSIPATDPFDTAFTEAGDTVTGVRLDISSEGLPLDSKAIDVLLNFAPEANLSALRFAKTDTNPDPPTLMGITVDDGMGGTDTYGTPHNSSNLELEGGAGVFDIVFNYGRSAGDIFSGNLVESYYLFFDPASGLDALTVDAFKATDSEDAHEGTYTNGYGDEVVIGPDDGWAVGLRVLEIGEDEKGEGGSAKFVGEDWNDIKDNAVPEPASMALMGLGSLLAGCGVIRRKRKNMAEELSS